MPLAYTNSSSTDYTTALWCSWNSSGTDATWSTWTTTTACNGTPANYNTYTAQPYVETPEMKRAREESEQRAKEAKARAAVILRRHLDAAQEASWNQHGHFDVTVESADRPPRHYRIKRGIAGNIYRLENGVEVEKLCVHPHGIPEEDVNLAQLLHLHADEEGLRRIANITRLRAA